VQPTLSVQNIQGTQMKKTYGLLQDVEIIIVHDRYNRLFPFLSINF